MAETTAPKPSSSVKLVLLGEAAVGKVETDVVDMEAHVLMLRSRLSFYDS
jgi:hypothetical protein